MHPICNSFTTPIQSPDVAIASLMGPDNEPQTSEAPNTQVVGRLLGGELQSEEREPGRFDCIPTPILSAASMESSPLASPAPSTSEITPFPIPPNLATWRRKLFQFGEGETLELSSHQWQQYWPYMTNVWSRHALPYTPKRKQTVRTHWRCRFHKERAGDSLSTGRREKRVRQPIGCTVKLTEVHDLLAGHRMFTMAGTHNHTIEDLDMTKVNDGIHSWVKKQLLRGFLPTAIGKVAKGKGNDPSAGQNVLDAGGRHLSIQYIRNAAVRLGIQNPQPLPVGNEVLARSQIMEAYQWLQDHGETWFSAILETANQGSASPCLVFSRKSTLCKLRDRGILTLMDSMHSTNKEEWCVPFRPLWILYSGAKSIS
jgi:hypothetical protein